MIKKIGYALGGVVALAAPFMASAASLFEVPTSTVSDLTANITSTIADPGLLLVIVFAAALPVVFWLVHKIIGLFPKARK